MSAVETVLQAAGAVLARVVPTRQPAVLVFSLPRSGSSWVGQLLGAAADAAYLREPITQGVLAAGGDPADAVDVDPLALPGRHRQIARAAFEGIPRFSAGIAMHASQWRLRGRRRRRVIVKEVNPLLLDEILRVYRPRLILLIRHPAAVAASYARLGWDSRQQHARVLQYRAASELPAPGSGIGPETASFWARQGDFQGAVLSVIRERLLGLVPHEVVRYEALCADPEGGFRTLFDFAGLDWDDRIRALVQRHSRAGSAGDTFGTSRNSASMAEAWRRGIGAEQLEDVAAAFGRYGLPWYREAAEWTRR